MAKYRLDVIVFVCGAVLMILELAGSRVVAPYFGTSIYTWTSLIGVILGSLSAGYWWGGRLADRGARWRTLLFLILSASCGIILCNLFKGVVLGLLQERVPDVRLGSAIAVTALFGPPSLFLGTVSPYAVRLALRDLERSGSTVGRLYAVSTLGSIAGTFLAGFYLLSFLGTALTLTALSFLLLAASMLTGRRGLGRGGWIAAAALGILLFFVLVVPSRPGERARRELDTRYSHVVVEDTLEGATHERVRWLRTGPRWAQSAMSLERPDVPYFRYNRFYALADYFVPSNRRALLIGGGACTFPRYFLRRRPGALIDVVEVDPGITEIARKYFALKDDPRMRIIHADGRNYLERSATHYDVIFVDVFKASGSPPFHLATLEAFRAMARRLEPGGAVLMNVYSAILGPEGRFLRAVIAGFSRIFPLVHIFPVQFPDDAHAVQNVLIVARKKGDVPFSPGSPDPLLAGYLAHRWPGPVPRDVPVLTDDKAPVARYLGKILREM